MSIVDSFVRANETPLAAPWSTIGSWSKPNLSSNGVTGAGFTRHSAPAVDQYARITIATVPTGTDYCAALVRCQSGAQSCFLGYVRGNAEWGLQRVIAGSTTALISATFTVTAGDTLELEIVSGTLRLYQNGTERLAAVDTNGQPGGSLVTGDVGLSTSATGKVTNFVAAPVGLPGTPTILGPVYTAETVINGLGQAGLLVEVYKGGTLQANPAFVSGEGRWSYTFGSGLSTGDVLKARQKDEMGNVGLYTADLTVQVAVVTPPSILGGLYSGNTHVIGFAKPGVVVELFKGGVSQGSVNADNVGVFRYIAGAGFTTGNVWTAKQTIAGTLSGASPSVTVKAAHADTTTYKDNIFASMVTYDFIKNANDTDDVRRTVCAVLERSVLLGSSVHEIKNAMGGLFYQYAARIAQRNG